MVRLWFRAEEKPHERRTIILPEHVQGYVDAGFNVTIERSSQRCVPDAEFEPLVDGTRVQLVAEGAWRDRQQPQKGKKTEEEEVVVTGIKELFPEEYTAPLSDTFVQFGHAYKMQVGWKDFLGRFGDGGGTLLDLEYLVDDTGRRVAAYGHWAGYVGAGLGVLAWCTQVQTGCASILGAVDMTAYEAGKEIFIAEIKAQLAAAQQVVEARGETFRPPAAVVIGALGRCGRGATELLRAVGLDGLGLWDMAETARGGPFPELLEYSIIVNCILLTSDVDKPFLVRDMLYQVDRRLSVIVDVACDPSAPHNPLPIYTEGTTFEAPALRLIDNVPGVHEAVDLIAIDHLPSLLPREASRTYCQQIVPHLLKLGKWRDDSVWHRAFAMFVRKSYAARGQSIVWLREETKPFERRAALTPQHAAILISRGVHVVVERMATRCFPDADYEAVGCQMATGGDWKVYAPLTAFILGIKELPAADTGPLEHDHIYFGHCYKQQAGWKDLLARFEAGGGRLHDLEFLMDDEGKRLAAFGFWAGWAGTALGLLAWNAKRTGGKLGAVSTSKYAGQQELLKVVRDEVTERPRVAIIGAQGRCGSGAHEMLRAFGLENDEMALWDVEETRKGGPFPELVRDYDIVINCILLSSDVDAAFVTREMIQPAADRRLSVLVDVSCDPDAKNNPFPVYSDCTTFDDPVERGPEGLDVIAIDHLPSLLPVEASVSFCESLLPHLIDLRKSRRPNWERCVELFKAKLAEAKE